MNEEKYYRLIVDLWRLFRQVIQEKNRKGTSWSRFEAKAVLFAEQHDNSRLAKDLALAIADELERREMQE